MKTKSAFLLLLALGLSLTQCNNVIHDLVPWDDPRPNPTVTTIGPQSQAITIGVPGVLEDGALSANFAVTTTGILGEKPITIEWFMDSAGVIPMGPPPGVTNKSPTLTFSTNPAVPAYITLAATEETPFGVYYFRVVVGDVPGVDGGSIQSSGVGRLQIDTWHPKFNAAAVDGVLLVIELTEPVTGTPDPSDFTVSGIAANPYVTAALVNGTTVIILTLSSPAAFGENSITVTYNRNANSAKHLLDADGNFTESFVNKPVLNNTGVPKRVLNINPQVGTISARVTGSAKFGVYTQGITGVKPVTIEWFSDASGTIPGGVPVDVSIVSPVSFVAIPTDITLTTTSATYDGKYFFKVSVYEDNGTPLDTSDDILIDQSDGVGTLTVDLPPRINPPEFNAAAVDGVLLVIELTEPVTGTPDLTDFTVSGIVANPYVTDASVNGTTITLTLSSPASFGENNIRVTYIRNADRYKHLLDSDGNFTESFVNKPVTNNTGVPKQVLTIGPQSQPVKAGEAGSAWYAVATTGITGVKPVRVEWFSDNTGAGSPITPPVGVTFGGTGAFTMNSPVAFVATSTNIAFTTTSATPYGKYFFKVSVYEDNGTPLDTSDDILIDQSDGVGTLAVDLPPQIVSIGPQRGVLIARNAGSADYTIETEGILGAQVIQLLWYTNAAGTTAATAPAGVDINPSTVTILRPNPSDIRLSTNITLTTTAATPAGIYYFRVKAAGVTSIGNTGVLRVYTPGAGVLYLGANTKPVPGTPTVVDAFNWLADNVNGTAAQINDSLVGTENTFYSEYTIKLTAEDTAPPYTLDATYLKDVASNAVQLTITTEGTDAYALKLNGQGSLFTVPAGVTLTLDGYIVLKGYAVGHDDPSDNNAALVTVNGGTLQMLDHSQITGNKTTAANGGGVYVYNGGTFTMNNDSSVLGNTSTASTNGVGGVYVTGAASTFTMNNNATVRENTSIYNAGGVYVNSGSTFIMNNDSSVNNNIAVDSGGGVYIMGSDFVMNSTSSIKDNINRYEHGGRGGGAYISGGTFTMNTDSYVRGNTGIGVYAVSSCAITMKNDSSIHDNTLGGVNITGTLIMDDSSKVHHNSGYGITGVGDITMNTSSSVYDNTGIGVVHSGSGTFTMNNNTEVRNNSGRGVTSSGKIELNNYSSVKDNAGGGVSFNGTTFNMKDDSSVKDNGTTGSGSGGGVYITAGTLTMEGRSSITGNEAANGGGVYVGTNSAFTMNDSSYVRNNTASVNGGGVYLYSSLGVSVSYNQNVTNNVSYTTTCTMNGSSDISGNSAALGSGVYITSLLSVTHGNNGISYTVTNNGNITSTLTRTGTATLSDAVYGVSSLTFPGTPSGRVFNNGQSKSEYIHGTTDSSTNGSTPFTVP
ncbi:hypothetical protein FACS189445_1730 [Spirochaetia bacterium]|nr:hypothetical protein FACS189445_1730 [Spirochaetia bacterium]